MDELSYLRLYFADDDASFEMDSADMFTTVRAKLYLDNKPFPAVFSIPALGGTPAEIDMSTLYDIRDRNKAGRQSSSTLEISYRYTNALYEEIERLRALAGSVAMKIVLKGDGTTGDAEFTNTGKCKSNYVDELSDNSAVNAKAAFEVSGEWKKSASSTPAG